jgi:hypothetical protein
MKQYFTRLTPNTKNWKKPSGKSEKCKAADSAKPLYEETHCFGWEEWLFEDYYDEKETCLGFLQAFNDKNKEFTSVDVIHLYTRICDGNKPKEFYVGQIKNVIVLPKNQRAASENQKKQRIKDLNAVDISNFPSGDPMWDKCFNIQFERKNVILQKTITEIKLERGQFRFALYDVSKHPNFLNQINRIKTK